MKDRNNQEIHVKDMISIDREKQPIFQVLEFRGTNAIVKCIDDKGEGFFKDSDTLWIPETALLRYETFE